LRRGFYGKAGVAWSIPAVLFLAFGLAVAGVAFGSPPAREPLPDVGKPRLHREETPLEKAVGRAAFLLEKGSLPPSEDAVRFALWMYADRGDVSYRNQAESLARKLTRVDPRGGNAAYSLLGQAGLPYSWGSPDLEAKRPPNDTSPLPPHQDLSAAISQLRAEMNEAQVSGSDWLQTDINRIAHDVVARFLEMKSDRFIDPAAPDSALHRDNARTALTMWEAGLAGGDSSLVEIGRRALESDLEAALQDSNAVASVGLAAGRMSRHPLQMAVIGDPADSTVTALRQAAYFVFAPDKVILNLDPVKDAERMKALMYPSEVAPALFVCVGTLCSAPIKDAALLKQQVAEIRKLAAQVQQ
jgi:hypothetical protein